MHIWKVGSLPMLVPLSFQACILLLHNDQPAQSKRHTLRNAYHTLAQTQGCTNTHTLTHTRSHTRRYTHTHTH